MEMVLLIYRRKTPMEMEVLMYLIALGLSARPDRLAVRDQWVPLARKVILVPQGQKVIKEIQVQLDHKAR